MDQNNLKSKVHHGYLSALLKTGRIPTAQEVATSLAVPVGDVQDGLKALESSHGVVLHPHTCEPWIMHPFAFSPSATWVQGEKSGRGWWAPCIWCAAGQAELAKEPVVVHARLGGEAQEVKIHIEDGKAKEVDLWVHFARPVTDAWDNVHHTCGMCLPFASEADIDLWSTRHGLPRGTAVPIQQVVDLGREWYGTFADADWTKWSVKDAAAIFKKVGLVGPGFALPEVEGGF